MLSAHALADDLDTVVSLLVCSPHELKLRLAEDIGRWQTKRIIVRIPEAFVTEAILRNAIFCIKDPVRRGRTRLLLASGCWAPARKYQASLRETPLVISAP